LSFSKSISQRDSTLVWRTQWIDTHLIIPGSLKNVRPDFSTLFFSCLLSQITQSHSANKYQVSNSQQLSLLFCLSFSSFAVTFEDTKWGDYKRSCRVVVDKAYLLICYCGWAREKENRSSLDWNQLSQKCGSRFVENTLKIKSISLCILQQGWNHEPGRGVNPIGRDRILASSSGPTFACTEEFFLRWTTLLNVFKSSEYIEYWYKFKIKKVRPDETICPS